jgi:hypothetical protein
MHLAGRETRFEARGELGYRLDEHMTCVRGKAHHRSGDRADIRADIDRDVARAQRGGEHDVDVPPIPPVAADGARG